MDIDGNKITISFESITGYRMNMNEEGWQEFLKSEIKLAIDTGADGIVLDDIQAQTLWIGFHYAGVFNEPDMQGFREFLRGLYTSEELLSRFGITDINTFNYKDYIRSSDCGEYLQETDCVERWKSDEPYEVPLFNEFKVFEYKSTLDVYRNIIPWAKDYAQSTYGKSIVFLGNTSNGLDMSIPFEEPLDLAWIEFPYDQYGYPPLCKVIPASKVKVDSRWKKGQYLTQVSTNADLIQQWENPSNIAKIFLAEAYASGAEYAVPYDVPGGLEIGYSPDLSVLAPYYQFIDRNRPYFGKNWTWKPNVAIFYPVSSYLGVSNSYFGTALALFDAGVQFDVIFSGDDRMMENKVTLLDLLSYPVIVLSNTMAMTSQQVELILEYVKSGGIVVGWGTPGGANEFNDWSIHRPSEWEEFWYVDYHYLGNGTYINLSNSDLGDDYFRDRFSTAKDIIIDAITSFTTSEISSTAPSNVNFLVYSNPTTDKLVVHIINYNYNIESDSITSIDSFTLSVRLPEGFDISGKTVKLISPDFSETLTLTYSVEGDSIIMEIPTLNFYDLLVIE